MDKLIDEFIKYVSTGNIWAGFLLLAVFYVLKKEPLKVIQFYSERRQKQDQYILELLKIEKIDTETQRLLQTYLAKTAFYRCYGISVDEEMREALIAFKSKYKDKITWREIRRAIINLSAKDKEIQATLKLGDHLYRWVVISVSWCFGAASLFAMLSAIYVGNSNNAEFFKLTLAAFLLFIAVLYFSTLNWQYDCTKKIIQLLEADTPKKAKG